MGIEDIDSILRLLNILLGIILGILSLRYTRFYAYISEFWRRVLLLAYLFILTEVAAFLSIRIVDAILKTAFIIYFIYILTYLTPIIKHMHESDEEIKLLKERLTELKHKEVEK